MIARPPERRLANDQICQFANRGLSQLQLAILEYLSTTPACDVREGAVSMIGWPRTGEIIDALGRRRDKKGFASVSRSLTRLAKADLIVCGYSQFSTRGGGAFYALRVSTNGPARADEPVQP